jgi:acetyl-CoA acyltransferase
VIGNFAGELFSSQGHLGAMAVRADEGLHGKPFYRTEGACASGGLAVVSCVDAIQAGLDLTLAAGAEVQTTVSARDGAQFLARAAHWETERELDDFVFPAMFARRAKLYKEKFGATDADIAHAVVKAYENGNKNPNAHMRTRQMTLETASAPGDRNPCFLKNEEYRDHLKMSDCSQVSDGGAALILASEEGLKVLGKKAEDCVELLSYGLATGPLGAVTDYTTLGTTQISSQEAYTAAGCTPDQIDVCEVHDCFAITEILMLEALGFADPGQGAILSREGQTRLDGKIPVNTGGGLMAFGHPVGATGVKQVLEIFRQMKGLCGDYQMKSLPKMGLTANMGGDDRTSVTMVIRNLD